ncbi:MAG: lipopolysaccharide transport periplasmic protein LptA [Legionella sp.]|jgi:lipopolysaccharide export system protein LptA
MIQRKLSLVISISLLSQPIFALPTDKNQVVKVFADSADLSQLLHRGIYKGHVEFNQGTTNIRAQTAITKGNTDNQLQSAIAQGSKTEQAHYWTEAGDGKPTLHAYADSIRYYPLLHLIKLKGNARVEQGKNSLSAATIIYDTEAQHVITTSEGSKRTTIIFYPEKKAS